MTWKSFINEVYLINLEHREDRLLESVALFERYEIPYTWVKGVNDLESGARGLRDTMLKIFNDALNKNHDNILIFEDDVMMCEPPQTFHSVMNQVTKQLSPYYHLCFLGCQPTDGYSSFYSSNLLPVVKAFATHAVMYSKAGIRAIMDRAMDYPIDNWLVDHIEPLGQSYAVDPILCSQRPGYSDICRGHIDWTPFIEQRHRQKINELRQRNL